MSNSEKDNSLENNKNEISLENILNENNAEGIQANNVSNQESTVFDINIQNINDLIAILHSEKYDFVQIIPQDESVKIIFKKESIVKNTKFIRFPVYQNILLETKKTCWLKIDTNSIEQKWVGTLKIEENSFEVIAKVVPSHNWEEIFVKTAVIDKKTPEKKAKKSWMDVKTAFGFLLTIFVIALILWGGFLSFIVFNAQTLQDVSFFNNLGINLNQINSFLLTTATIVFSILVLLQTILLIIFLFKAFLTKKEFKRKKTIATIVSIILFIFTFTTGTFWLVVDKKIRSLPNWQEMSYGSVQVFDNALLVHENFWKEWSLLSNFENLVWPIELKFDLNQYNTEQARQGFRIDQYIWKFNAREEIHNSPEIIKNFNTSGITTIELTVVWQDRTGRTLEKIVTDVPKSISISNVVKIDETIRPNGGKILSFDASAISNLWTIEWYLPEDISTPAFTWPRFIPGKVYFEESMVGMIIRNPQKKGSAWDRIFIIQADKNEMNAQIEGNVSYDNDLTYTFQVKDIKSSAGDGFIENFLWNIEGKETFLRSNLDELEKSSQITHTFKTYGPQTIRVKITNTRWQVKEITQELNIPKQIKISQELSFSVDKNILEDFGYEPRTGDYILRNIWVPSEIMIDAREIRADNILYTLNEIKWDVGGDGSIQWSQKTFSHTFDTPGEYMIVVHYIFQHRRNSEDTIEMSQNIYIETATKEAILDLKVQAESEYVPTNVIFDASESKVENDDIVKFIYDYGDGVVEERDAINLWHKYNKAGTYDITLTVVTRTWKEYSISKKLVLKPQQVNVKITSSLSRAPVGQEISFLSAGSEGQITRYFWDFWDGFSSTEPNPNYAYKNPGKYTVTLTLDYINNNTLSDKMEVEIYARD